VSVLAPAPAQDQNGIAVTRETADEHDLRTISDLAPIANEFVFGGPFECPQRPLCLPGLESRYGIQFRRFVGLDTGGFITVSVLRAGDVDAALLFSSDAVFVEHDLVLLADDLGLQPAENVTPVIRGETLERWPQLETVLDDVSAALTTGQLRELNAAVTVQQLEPAAVAAEWLRSHGFAASG
jgi:osmoprotectant transport system substrate-binding protein